MNAKIFTLNSSKARDELLGETMATRSMMEFIRRHKLPLAFEGELDRVYEVGDSFIPRGSFMSGFPITEDIDQEYRVVAKIYHHFSKGGGDLLSHEVTAFLIVQPYVDRTYDKIMSQSFQTEETKP